MSTGRYSLFVIPLLIVGTIFAYVRTLDMRAGETRARRDGRSTKEEGPAPQSLEEIDEGPAVAEPPVNSGTLLYLQGTVLRSLTLDDSRTLDDLGTEDVFAAPLGDVVATVEAPLDGDGDFAASPMLKLISLPGGNEVPLGEGFAPHWDHDGRRVAYLHPTSERDCFAETCEGTTEVVVSDLTGSRKMLSGEGVWSILGWLGDELMIVDLDDPSRVSLVGGRTDRFLDIAPGSVWGGSPDGRWLIVYDDSGARALAMSNGSPSGEVLPIDTGGRPLGQGGWTGDSSAMFAVVLDGSLTGARSTVIEFRPSSGTVLQVPGSRGAMGQVLPVDGGVLFAAIARRGRLEARLCLAQGCEGVLAWRRDVSLLSFH